MDSASEIAALENCAREPIRTPGAIQAFGHLLVCDKSLETVLQCSQNISTLFGRSVEDTLNQSVASLVGQELHAQIRDRISSSNKSKAYLRATISEQELCIISHLTDDYGIIEIEPIERDLTLEGFLVDFESIIDCLQPQMGHKELLKSVTRQIKTLSGFDRVMVYKFDEEWNGKVVAEEREADLEPYLGLNYPASDIPPQARALYETQLVRVIVDTLSQNQPLVSSPDCRTKVDLGETTMRAVSPIHIEYLHNMGVRATLTISILLEGRLWGLIACHHRAPKHVDMRGRSACRMLSSILSSKIEAAISHEKTFDRLQLNQRGEKLFENLLESFDVEKSLAGETENLMDFIPCDGAALVRGATCKIMGTTLPELTIRALIDEVPFDSETSLFHTNKLARFLPQDALNEHAIAGVIIAPISHDNEQCMLWFRLEKTQTIEWGGNPQKTIKHTDNGPRLSPRKSFEKWTEIVKDQAEPWTEIEIRGVAKLRSLVVDIFAKRSLELEELNTRLALANEALESFTHTVSHDLRAPLRRIKIYSEMLMEHQDFVSDHPLHRIESSAKQMNGLIVDLLEFSKIGHIAEWRFQSIDMTKLAREVFRDLTETERVHKIDFTCQELPAVWGDRTLLRQLLENLFSNAIKYTSHRSSPAIKISGASKPGYKTFCVEDNGVGFDMAHREKIFDIFQRFQDSDRFPGTGIGLAIARRIAKAHRGSIWAKSKQGEGSEFYFQLPVMAM
ncbi:ATP-binding protein [Pelagicoccus albus]|uniref:histidine kinase n=1 Tax=Pelagicoccus albus TaxID=415222 RepID=A0A7X1E763_9BACT|nr:ATP-binding protein [Pelagicoccus albus]MBC2604999.1 GAF domain-containing protein [Pelagicoccus albus]